MEEQTVREWLGLSDEDMQNLLIAEQERMAANIPTNSSEAVSYGDTLNITFFEDSVEGAVMPFAVTEKGKIIGGFYFPPTVDRMDYIWARHQEAVNSNYDLYAQFTGDVFYHALRRDEINYYPPDMIRVMELFSRYSMDDNLKIVRATERPKRGANVHSIGLAIDIEAKTRGDAKRIADAAYRTGIPNIVYGGNFNTGDGYVHLDIGPRFKWQYGAGVYSGPGTK